MNRRSFLASTFASAATASLSNAAIQAGKLPIGLDHFSVRATGWKAAQYIDYAASLKLDTIFLSELGVFENYEEAYLKSLKAQADRAGLKIYVGTGSVCDSSNTWKPANGTGADHLALTIKIAKALGSPVARCYLGNQKDRATDGGIAKHIENTVKSIKANQSRAEAEGIKIAIENHAGDMQSAELRELIEIAGKGYVGANIDPGNAVWALEEPMQHLEVLGPVTVCSSVRDSMLWEDEKGTVMVQWTAVGEGLVDFKAYAKRFAELAPGVPLQVETISGFARPFETTKEEFWKIFPGHRDSDMYKAWLAMAKRGKKIESFKAPDGPAKKDAEIAHQKAECERSFQWLKNNA
ncbi:MAG: sugar phosphate isomerase/epimerase [Verrucomicrobiaceae bacterium]|nr:sugar phosphate isomerase/epimerase [Verrucomicrobiaceae bacterium]